MAGEPRRGNRRSRGFTLIEILVALVVLAILIGVSLQSFSTGLNSLTRAERHMIAALYAESLLESLGVVDPITVGESAGELEGGYRWHLEVQPDPTTDPNGLDPNRPILLRVRLRVTWSEAADGAGVVLETSRLEVLE